MWLRLMLEQQDLIDPFQTPPKPSPSQPDELSAFPLLLPFLEHLTVPFAS